jgi:hypothetical protein
MLRHLYFACCRSDLAIEPARWAELISYIYT